MSTDLSYSVQHLLDVTAGSAGLGVVTCAQALGRELYIGCADGSLLRFALTAHAQVDEVRLGSTSTQTRTHTLLSSQTILPNKPIQDIILLPAISRALILTDAQLHIYTLPTLDPAPLPPRSKPVRDVIGIAVDERHLYANSNSFYDGQGVFAHGFGFGGIAQGGMSAAGLGQAQTQTQTEPVELCIIKQAGILQCTLMKDRLNIIQDLPLPTTPLLARLSASLLFMADKETYSLVSFKNASFVEILPIVQVPDDSEMNVEVESSALPPPPDPRARSPSSPSSSPTRSSTTAPTTSNTTPNTSPTSKRFSHSSLIKPRKKKKKPHNPASITLISPTEFLLLSTIAHNSMGVMVNAEGEPVRGTLEWEGHPCGVVCSPATQHLTVLLPPSSTQLSYTVQVHHLETLQTIQIIHLDRLSSPTYGLADPSKNKNAGRRDSKHGHDAQLESDVDVDVEVALVPAHAGYFVPEMERLRRVRKVGVRMGRRHQHLEGQPSSSSSSSTTPTYAPSQILLLTTSTSTPIHATSGSTSTSTTSSALSSLIPTPLLIHAESLLAENKIEDAVRVAEEARRGRMLDVQGQGQGLGHSSSSSSFSSSYPSTPPRPSSAHASTNANNNTNNTDQPTPTPTDIDTSYIFQLAALLCFARARFDDAGRYFLEGGVDPRVVVWYFEEVRGVFASVGGAGASAEEKEEEGEDEDEIEMFAGVVEYLPREGSVDEIALQNIVKNYSPYLGTPTLSQSQMQPQPRPQMQIQPPTQQDETHVSKELRRVLGMAAREMLGSYLKRWRLRRAVEGGGSRVGEKEGKVDEVVDTTLLLLLASSSSSISVSTPLTPTASLAPSAPTSTSAVTSHSDLFNLITSPNSIVLSAYVVSELIRNGQYFALCLLYEQRGEEAKVLDVWAKLADSIWTDADIPESLENMKDLLKRTSNRALVQTWGIWMLSRDMEAGLELLISRDSKRSKPEEEKALLKRIEEASPVAGERYLEYLILKKRSTDRELHIKLVSILTDRLLDAVKDEATEKLWRAKSSSYASRSDKTDSPFLLYFAQTTPDSDSKRVRIRTALFLQASSLYDVDEVRKKIEDGYENAERVLGVEMAILYGKLQNHISALSLLASSLRDSSSAESYCTLGGEVVSAKVAVRVAEECGLGAWAGLFGLEKRGQGQAGQRVADEGTRAMLLKVLLEVYMKGGEQSSHLTARLLNSQAINLDIIDVLHLLPPTSTLQPTSTFLARSLRRIVHSQHEGMITKALAAGENLVIRERSWLRTRDAGAVVEEEADGEGDDGEGQEMEKVVVSEKLQGTGGGEGGVVDVVVGEKEALDLT